MMIPITAEHLRELGNYALSYGTEDKFIPLAVEWAEKASEEVHRLRELNERLFDAVSAAFNFDWRTGSGAGALYEQLDRLLEERPTTST